MKKIFLILLVSLISSESYALTPTSLKPNLTAQMQKQTAINKQNLINEKKYAIKMRLAELRKKKEISEKKTAIVQKAFSPVVSNPPRITPVVTIPPTLTNYTLSIPGIDISRVRDTWFGWYNNYRTSLGLGSYDYNPRLDSTARDWNIRFAEGRGQNHHTRTPGDGYYNFSVIDSWFKARGIDPIVINRSKHTENVGYGYYNCNQSDCTDEMIRSIRSTFDFFMSEKGKSYDAHYRSIINPYFTKMGFDIIIVPSEKRYYITVHYITK